MAVRSYGPDTDFGYVFTVTLTLDVWPWVKVMTHPWVTANNCVKYYSDLTWQWELWPGHGFCVFMHCDLNLWGRYPPLDHGQQFCKILSRSNMAVRSYGPDMDFGYVCTVTFTLDAWPWVKIMTHPWVTDNKCVKYYSDLTYQWRYPWIFGMGALWPWPLRYELRSRSWHTLGSWAMIVWSII